MTHFLSLADHYGTVVHVIGTALALFFLALIASESVFRARRQRRNEQRLRDRTAKVMASATRTRPAA